MAAAALSAAIVQPANADPAAWRVTGKDGGQIWLLGSMHYLRAEDYPLPASLDALFENAEALVMELDLDDLGAAEQASTLLETAVLPPGTRLPDVLESDLYARAERHARALGIDLAQLANFEPWMVAITLLDRGMNELGYEPGRGLEQYFLDKAQRSGKEIHGLETLERQISVFDELPPREQHALLEQTLEEIAIADAAMQELGDAWRDGRLEELAEKLQADFADFPALYDSLMVDRNRQWVKPLEDFLEDGGRYLVIVGALHLVGADSVVELLRQRGHDVTLVE
jgi:uncharacterized protein YbaP (TraB family)